MKTTNELLLLRSDLYGFGDELEVVAQTDRPDPRVDLDEHYTLIDDFDARFPAGRPSLRRVHVARRPRRRDLRRRHPVRGRRRRSRPTSRARSPTAAPSRRLRDGDLVISVEQHLDRILSTVKVIRPFELGVLDAQGCVLAADVEARGSLPGFTNSAMDGYAVHAADVATASADAPGRPARRQRHRGGQHQGAVARDRPDHADHDRRPDAARRRRGRARRGDRRGRRPGRRSGSAGPSARTCARPARTSRPATSSCAGAPCSGPGRSPCSRRPGIARVRVVPRPRVVVISTGDELVEVGRTPGFGQIVDSNSVMLTAAVTAVGATPFRVGGVARRRPRR